jgi:hypothetical protein
MNGASQHKFNSSNKVDKQKIKNPIFGHQIKVHQKMPLSQSLQIIQSQKFEPDYYFFKKIKQAYACGHDGEGGEKGLGINKTHDFIVTEGENVTTLLLKEKEFIDNYPTDYSTTASDFVIAPKHLK